MNFTAVPKLKWTDGPTGRNHYAISSSLWHKNLNALKTSTLSTVVLIPVLEYSGYVFLRTLRSTILNLTFFKGLCTGVLNNSRRVKLKECLKYMRPGKA